MGFVDRRMWLDDEQAERDERIGEHEAYLSLFDLANNRYLGNRVPWDQALVPFMTDGVREVVATRFRVVPRCHCDPTWWFAGGGRQGEEWTGTRHVIVQGESGEIDLETTEEKALQEWRDHVEALRNALEAQHRAAAMQRGAHLVALNELRKLAPMERHGAIRTARNVLDVIEIEAVVESRREGRSWTEVGIEMGISRQAARERFLKHDPRRNEA